jgi:hypothetical protein
LLVLAPVPYPAGTQTAAAAAPAAIEKGDFRFSYDERGISGLANPHDPFGATLMPAAAPGARAQGAGQDRGRAPVAGLIVRYRTSSSGEWADLVPRGAKWAASPEAGAVSYTSGGPSDPLKVFETFKTDGRVLDWTIDLETTGKLAVQVGDLGISVPSVGPMGENPIQIFERGFLRHQFVSGHGSFGPREPRRSFS